MQQIIFKHFKEMKTFLTKKLLFNQILNITITKTVIKSKKLLTPSTLNAFL